MTCSATQFGDHFTEPLGHPCPNSGEVNCVTCGKVFCLDHVCQKDGNFYCTFDFHEHSRVSRPINGTEWDRFLGKIQPETIEE